MVHSHLRRSVYICTIDAESEREQARYEKRLIACWADNDADEEFDGIGVFSFVSRKEGIYHWYFSWFGLARSVINRELMRNYVCRNGVYQICFLDTFSHRR